MADAVDTEQEARINLSGPPAKPQGKISEKRPVTDWSAAMAAVKRAQERGDWPERRSSTPPQQTARKRNPTAQKEPTAELSGYDPAKKLFPTEEERAKVLSSVPATEETIPPEIKKELTEEAKKLNTIAMEGSDVKSESSQQPMAPTLSAEQAQSRQEGVERFKKILEAKRKAEEVKSPPTAPFTTAPEVTPAPVAAEAPLSGQEEQEEDNRPEWLRKQAPFIRKGQHQAAMGQAGQKPTPSIREQRAQRAVEQLIETKTKTPTPPPPTSEQVAAAQSVHKGQEIKKRWTDRIPFLKILRRET